MPAMTPRKRNKPERGYPDDWVIRFEWDFTKAGKVTTVESRQFDVKVDRSWYMFDHLVSTGAGAVWLDCFELYPMGGFKAFRPERVTQVRRHQEPKRKAVANAKR